MGYTQVSIYQCPDPSCTGPLSTKTGAILTRSRAGARFRCVGPGVFSILINVLAYNIKICHSAPGDGARSSV
jgi:hypothetical protein